MQQIWDTLLLLRNMFVHSHEKFNIILARLVIPKYQWLQNGFIPPNCINDEHTSHIWKYTAYLHLHMFPFKPYFIMNSLLTFCIEIFIWVYLWYIFVLVFIYNWFHLHLVPLNASRPDFHYYFSHSAMHNDDTHAKETMQ